MKSVGLEIKIKRMLRALFEWLAGSHIKPGTLHPSESIGLIQLTFIVKNRFICKIFFLIFFSRLFTFSSTD